MEKRLMMGYVCPECGKSFGREIKEKYPKFKIEAKLLWRHIIWQHPEYMIRWFSKNHDRWMYIRRKIVRTVMTSERFERMFGFDIEEEGENTVRCFFWEPEILKLISDMYIDSKTVKTVDGSIEEIVDMIGSYWFKHERPDVRTISGEIVSFVR